MATSPSAKPAETVAASRKNVNDADTVSASNQAGQAHRSSVGPAERTDLIELLFFAYRDFVARPDAVLADLGLGRAHHRVLHFVHRSPGLAVADLLRTLRITKQSLGRVLKELIDARYVEQKEGPRDRRQRLLYATASGRVLAERLSRLQSEHIEAALGEAGRPSEEAVRRFLLAMISAQDRAEVALRIGAAGATLDAPGMRPACEAGPERARGD